MTGIIGRNGSRSGTITRNNAITFNSDGTLSGNFPSSGGGGGVKYVYRYRAMGTPSDTSKMWIAYGITTSYYHSSYTGKYMAFGFGQPVAVLTYNNTSQAWNSWIYINPSGSGSTGWGALGNTYSSPSGSFWNQAGYTHTVEMEKV